jgi:hypothetical protein
MVAEIGCCLIVHTERLIGVVGYCVHRQNEVAELDDRYGHLQI